MVVLENNKKVVCTCPSCRKGYTFNLTDEEYEKFVYYTMGGDIFIQNVFPTRSASDRELLRGGICGECWDTMFAFDEEDYEEE